ncbi:MAG: UvrD-helicase domain-containing protein [Rikenellaceae bacterium]
MGQLQIIKASAGSGKTYRLTLEYIRGLIISPESYRNILAVTFTNKATSEMKERILRELFELSHLKVGESNPFYDEFCKDSRINRGKIVENAARALSYILHDYSLFSILTIDKFFQKIIRSFVKELGLEGGYNIKFDNDYIIEMAIDKLLDKSKQDRELWKMLESIIGNNLKNGKAADVKRVVVKLARKIADEKFTAADESHLGLFKVIEESFESTIGEICAKATHVKNLVATYNITGEQLPGKSRSFMGDVNKISARKSFAYGKTTLSTAIGEKKWGKGVDEISKEEIITELYELITMLDNTELFRNSCSVVLKNYRPFLLLGRISDQINDINRDSGSMMLSQSMRVLSELINENDAPFIYEKIGTTFTKYMIDEFQDTSTQQWKNFVPLINNSLSSGEGTTVTLLGDVKQSIYGWRGGNWRLLGGDLTDDILSKEQIAPLESLTTNWRSEPNVIDFNNCFMARFVEAASNNLNEKLSSALESGYIDHHYHDHNHDILKNAYEDLYQEVSPRATAGNGYISVDYCDYTTDEHLIKMIENIEDAQRRGFSAGDIAILVRTKKEAAAVADHIIKYRSEIAEKGEINPICYDFVSSEALKLSYCDTVRLIVAIMRASQTADLKAGNLDSLTFNTLRYNSYEKELSKEDYEFIHSLKYYPLNQCFERIVSNYSLDNDETIVSYLQAFHQKIVTFSSDESSEISLFLEWWDTEGDKSAIYMPESGNSMIISTVHASKGLEFKVVILPFARQNLSPQLNSLFWANSSSEPFNHIGNILVNYENILKESLYSKSYLDYTLLSYIESTNILYVALTRSCVELYIMLSQRDKKEDEFDSSVDFLIRDGVLKTKESSSDGFEKGEKQDINAQKSEKKAKKSNSVTLKEYPSHDFTNKLKIRQSTRRYYQEGEANYLSPRHYGVIMHKLFERIDCSDDVSKALNDMVSEGIISVEDSSSTMDAILLAFQNPLIKEWFDSRWIVKAENDILMPMTQSSGYHTYRPDRVLIDGDEAVVIDYKFGMPHPKHTKQVTGYKTLLTSMGYTTVSGYVWYVVHNEVVEV